MSKNTVHVVSHTHWDREWRAGLWSSRIRLLKMMDALLLRFENDDDYRAFLLDGQVIAVEDYLEQRPEKRDLIKRLVKDGRLNIGPWYNLPDEYPVCGESLIRNLLWGIRKSAEFGKSLKVGYTSFGWGQSAHLPQLYKGFGMDFSVIGKHVGKVRAPFSEFKWQSPDGTEILSTRLGAGGRANFYFDVILPMMYNKNYKSEEWGFEWPGKGLFVHKCDWDDCRQEHQYVPRVSYNFDMVEECIRNVIATTEETTVKNHRFAGDGCDYTGPTQDLSKVIAKLNESCDDFEFKHSSLEDYVKAVKESLDPEGLPLVTGELRDGPSPSCSANALATRINLKMLNRKAQTLLISKAEPMSVLAEMMGIAPASGMIEKAWEYLLKSQSHDAINGVTLDKTANDVSFRLSQVIEISNAVFDELAFEIIKRIDLSGLSSEDIPAVIFNPSFYEADKIEEVLIDTPIDWGSQYLCAFDGKNSKLPIQHVEHWEQTVPVSVYNSRALPFETIRHRVYVQTGVIEPMGYKVIHFKRKQQENRKAHFWPVEYDFGSQLTASNTMENEHLRVIINSDGSFDMQFKLTGKIYRNLNIFEDSGEGGNYWQRIEPSHNKTITTLGKCAVETALVEDGPIVTSFECRQQLDIPSCYDEHNRCRSGEKVPLEIKSTLTLYKNEPFVRVRTRINNKAEDHRVRVCFRTELESEYSLGQGHFGIDKRPVVRSFDEDGKRDAHMNTLPMQGFIALEDGEQGFAVINKGLTEYEISDNFSREIYVTLLRSVPIKICSEFRCALTAPEQTGSQCFGEFDYEYLVYPWKGDISDSDVYKITETFNNPPTFFQVLNDDKGQVFATEDCFMKIMPERVQLICLKKSANGDGFVLRLFNSDDSVQKAKVNFSKFKPSKIFVTNLNEEPFAELEVSKDNMIETEIAPQKIVTLLLEK